MMDEKYDDVKQMNAMVLATKVATVREIQVEENKRLEHEFQEDQKRLYIMMEIERLKDIKEQALREQRRKVAAHKGAR